MYDNVDLANLTSNTFAKFGSPKGGNRIFSTSNQTAQMQPGTQSYSQNIQRKKSGAHLHGH